MRWILRESGLTSTKHSTKKMSNHAEADVENVTEATKKFSFKVNLDADEFVPTFAPSEPVAPKVEVKKVVEKQEKPVIQRSETESVKKELPPLEEDGKDHVNIVFIGHVDAGKSTLGGHILYVFAFG